MNWKYFFLPILDCVICRGTMVSLIQMNKRINKENHMTLHFTYSVSMARTVIHVMCALIEMFIRNFFLWFFFAIVYRREIRFEFLSIRIYGCFEDDLKCCWIRKKTQFTLPQRNKITETLKNRKLNGMCDFYFALKMLNDTFATTHCDRYNQL